VTGLGGWKYPQIAILVVATVFAARQFQDYWGSPAPHAAGMRRIGDCAAVLWHGRVAPGDPMDVRLRIVDASCWQALRQAHLHLRTADGRTVGSATFSGNRNHFTTRVAVPAYAARRLTLEVTFEGWDGRTRSARWPIDERTSFSGTGSTTGP